MAGLHQWVAHGQVQLDPSLTPYKTVSGVSGTPGAWGSDTFKQLCRRTGRAPALLIQMRGAVIEEGLDGASSAPIAHGSSGRCLGR